MSAFGLPHTAELPKPGAAALLALAVILAMTLACNFPLLATTVPEPEGRDTRPPTATASSLTTERPLPSATPSPSPSETATPTVTPTPTERTPSFTTSVNANCRTGPGTIYDVVRVLPQGTSEEIVGKDLAQTWWVVENGVRCWVSAVTGTVEGDTSGVPVIPAPPTPTTPPTSTYTPTPTLDIYIPLPIVTRITLPPRVSSVSVTVDATSYTGACPYRANWSATATATGALTADWIWQTSYDGTDWADTGWFGSVTFPGAGSQALPAYWFQTPDDRVIHARVHITAPNSIYSNAVAVTIDCTP